MAKPEEISFTSDTRIKPRDKIQVANVLCGLEISNLLYHYRTLDISRDQ